jgi:uncharacterized protein
MKSPEFTGRRARVRSGSIVTLLLLTLAGCTMQPVGRTPEAPRAESEQRAAVEQASEVLRQSRAEEALQILAELGRPVSVELAAAAAAVRGQALFRLGRSADAVAALVDREHWLERSADIVANQRMIWEGLALAGAPAARTGDRVIDGWLALAPLAEQPGTTDAEFRRQVVAWQGEFPNHPAARGLLSDYLQAPRDVTRGPPRQIALLLPLSSPQRLAAQAVRDGFMAAHLRAGEGGAATAIRVYDTTELGSEQAYQRAQQDGADFIVGPLLRPEVEGLVAHAGAVPTLALNFTQLDLPFMPGFYQFALAPEDDARAIARHAVASGARNAAALVPFSPGNDRADRILAAFRSELERLGGRLLVYDRYEPTASDYSAQVSALLNINRSAQRRTRLQTSLGTNLAFEPRLRQDVDFIFMIADPRAGRLLAPQLRFHDASHIPTYAISDVHEPGGRASESDLNGILFPDLPWVIAPDQTAASLKQELEGYWPNRSAGTLTRLFAMGFDAYQLVAPLHDWTGGFAPITGVSGRLVVDDRGRIRRELPLAQFRNGRPVAVDMPQRDPGQALGQVSR